MSDDPTRSFALTVDGGPDSEVFIVDSSFHLVARGISQVTRSLVAGVYKAKVRRGREELERIVLHDHDETVDLRPAPVASPVPISDSARVHEWHETAAERTSGTVHVRRGSGSQVFLLSRYWTAPNRKETGPPDHPGRGLTLRSEAGRILVNYEEQGELTPDARDPVVGCTAELDPGSYYLNRALPGGGMLAQSIVASAGWQTQIFVLRDPIRGLPLGQGSGAVPNLEHEQRPDAVSVIIGRGPFSGFAPDVATTEIARLALSDERRIMSADLMSAIEANPNNPMLGILGGHLLVLSLDRVAADKQGGRPDSLPFSVSPADLDAIVKRLRASLGDAHPDVEALSLRCVESRARTRAPLRTPPMLRRSWSLYVAASGERRDIVPGAVWNRVRQLVVAPPYLTWRRSPNIRPDPAMQLVRSVQRRDDRAERAEARRSQMDLRARLKVGPAVGRTPLPEEAVVRVDVAPPKAAKLRSARPRAFVDLRALSIANDIPINVLDDAIRRS